MSAHQMVSLAWWTLAVGCWLVAAFLGLGSCLLIGSSFRSEYAREGAFAGLVFILPGTFVVAAMGFGLASHAVQP